MNIGIKQKIFKFFILLIIVFSSIKAHSSSNDSLIPKQKSFIGKYIVDGKNLFLSPLKWDSKNQTYFFGAIATTAIVNSFDYKINEIFISQNNKTLNYLNNNLFNTFGEDYFLFPSLGIGCTYGLIAKDKKLFKTCLLGKKTLLYTNLVTGIIKLSIHRHRPYDDFYPDSQKAEGLFYNFSKNSLIENDYMSFPSGHTTKIFALATVISLSYKNKKAVKWIAYSLATLTALSRINSNEHWASDVVFSSMLGISLGTFFYKANKI